MKNAIVVSSCALEFLILNIEIYIVWRTEVVMVYVRNHYITIVVIQLVDTNLLLIIICSRI